MTAIAFKQTDMPDASNNLKEQVEVLVHRAVMRGGTRPTATQILNLILDTILAKTDELDKTYRGQYKGPDGADVIRDFKAMLEGLK